MNNILNNGKTIKIRVGEVNKPIVEEIENESCLDNAIFGSQYRQVLSKLNLYVKHREDEKNTSGDFSNNVFAFVGERGSGKTSCMSSVSNLLSSKNIDSFTSYPELKSSLFETLDIIDPSYFDEKHNIVAMVVAKLYRAYRNKEAIDSFERCNIEKRRELINAFAKAQKSMRCLLCDDVDVEDDDLERLSDLSMAVELKKDIHELVKKYLEFVNKKGGILVLSIDDVDLNISEAATMAEQLRKYFVSPNIIILLAAKLDQLATIKNLHYSTRYQYLIDKHRVSFEGVEDMTNQFLAKFAPHDQRIHMPDSDFFLESRIEINGDTLKGCSVKQAIPELIFNRTRYLFYNSKQTASYIVPRNLRKLCQLATMLYEMKPYGNSDKISNKEIFRNYLFGTWMQDNLSQENRSYIERILDGWHDEQLNKVTLDVLYDKFADWFNKQLGKDGSISAVMKMELGALFHDRNQYFNMSVGDVVSLIEILQLSHQNVQDKRFFFMVRTIYSMALYESYDKLTKRLEEKSNSENDEKRIENTQVLLYDPFDDEDVSQYHKLIAGRFFNYRLTSVLPAKQVKNKYVNRTDRIINFKELNTLISDSINMWESYKKQSGEKERLEMFEELSNKVRMAEFFMLCSIRDINLQHAKDKNYYDLYFRRNESIYYGGEYVGVSWLFFDLGAFFYNITNLDRCYKRFKDGKKLLDLCNSDHGIKNGNIGTDEKFVSLYSTFMQKAITYRGTKYDKYHAWQSMSSLRNAEIVFDLNQQLKKKCRKSETNNRIQLKNFFKVLSKYKIKTYDRDAENSFVEIGFDFVTAISELLENVSVEQMFNKIFNSIEDYETTEINLVDIQAALRNRKLDNNKKSSVINSLREKQREVYNTNKYVIELVFEKCKDRMTKDEIKEALTQINLLLSQNYGISKTNDKDTVSQSESETNIIESEE